MDDATGIRDTAQSGPAFRVREVALVDGRSWTVLEPTGKTSQPIDRYLGYLSDLERSPHTVRAYAYDLAQYFRFLEKVEVPWDAVTIEVLGSFVADMRRPAPGVAVLREARAARTVSTVNRMMASIASFYEFHERHGVTVNAMMMARGRSGSGSYRPFLQSIARSKPRGRVVKLVDAPRRVPRTLTLSEVKLILDAQDNDRNRLMFRWLIETGARIGQLLGLRHEDVISQERRITLTPRSDNANGARGKNGAGSVFVTQDSVRLYADYMHEEYGDLDSDYVFVNLWGGVRGKPMSPHTVYDIVERTRKKVGFDFTPHMFRHTFVTVALREGVPLETVSRLVTHKSSTTTSEIYAHLEAEDLRTELERAGVLNRLEELL